MKKSFLMLLSVILCCMLFGCENITNMPTTHTPSESENTTLSENVTVSQVTGNTATSTPTNPNVEVHSHTWKNATCTAPKTCYDCGATEGTTIAHNYVNGKCTTCNKISPDYNQETMVWIPTKGGKKYHTREDCSNMIDPDYVTKEEAEELGFTPCKRCH